MDTFRWLAVVLSTILGLATARILSGFVSAFKMRRRVNMDWLPLLMAAVVLIEIFQFWWALAELLPRQQWSMTDFGLLLSLAMTVFVAAALISPSDVDLASEPAFFERDGRYGLLVLSMFHIGALITDWWLWKQPLASAQSALVVGLAAICAVAALTKQRRIQIAMAALYLVFGLSASVFESPASY